MTAHPARTDGERWTRAQLAALRAASLSPAALARFLVAAQRRANEVRRARPALARQAQRWTAAGAGAWVVLAALGRQPFRRRVRGGLAWWGAVGLMLDWHLGMVESEDGEPRALGAADALTLARAWLVPVVADDLDPVAVLAAAASDVLDGVLARAAVPTRAGRDLEGTVDACLLVAGLAAARRTGRIGRAPLALELARQGAGTAYALAAYFGRGEPPRADVTRAGRVATPLRVAGLAAAGAGRRRAGGALLACGSLAGIAALASSA